ncbi:MAG TPA: ABC transporter substrate-binding protein [Nitrospinae bacterium]|nr:ABC transporter substrate-binding protein [Nitrospinota bacterium]
MGNLFKIAVRNLLRYKRRTLLTASLITIGVVFVLVFVSVSASFKGMMIGQITDSMLGHIQIHRDGYVASIENLPLGLNLSLDDMRQVEEILGKHPEIEAYSMRIKFGGGISNFVETTNIRLNGVLPEKEFRTVPLLPSRIVNGEKHINQGEIIIPELLSKGMNINMGDTVVVVATNKDGSVNGKQFKVAGIIKSVVGPGGRDGYIHLNDAVELLRMEKMEISEVAVRLKDFGSLREIYERLGILFKKGTGIQDKAMFEVHTWEDLSPFFSISKMIDLLTFFIKLMLIAIVLISIMNVMIMAVFERVREIGTIAAIGTLPHKILSMFIIEGLCLGVTGVFIGNIAGAAIIFILNLLKITFTFGQQKDLLLYASIKPNDILVISITVIIVSVIASLQPAFKASKMEPIEALRHV